eukprot:3640947-Rhodomonas_salina.1
MSAAAAARASHHHSPSFSAAPQTLAPSSPQQPSFHSLAILTRLLGRMDTMSATDRLLAGAASALGSSESPVRHVADASREERAKGWRKGGEIG